MEAGRQQRKNERSDALTFVAKKGMQPQGESEENIVIVKQNAEEAALLCQQPVQAAPSPSKEKTTSKPRPRKETHQVITVSSINNTPIH